jgi:leucyl aminopeptidase
MYKTENKMPKIIKTYKKISKIDNLVYIIKNKNEIENLNLTLEEIEYLKTNINRENELVYINRYFQSIFIVILKDISQHDKILEKYRRIGVDIQKIAVTQNIKNLYIINYVIDSEFEFALAEGIALSNYQFLKYFSDSEKKKNSLESIYVKSVKNSDSAIERLNNVIEAVFIARDLINEPPQELNSISFSEIAKKLALEVHFSIEVFNKAKIKEIGMGGLLAVNRGSLIPPTFTSMNWKPENAINEKPYIIIGKGITMDTGGLSLKPTADSMDYMKSDMSGGAAVLASMFAIAKSELPVWVMAFVPSTDNRPDGNAYAPGDVIKMYNGKTVEVLNTDAEGRLVLADALSYADNFNPELIIELSTLTGAASSTLGIYSSAIMRTAKDEVFNQLNEAAFYVHERLVELPLWDEYGTLINSDMADVKNVGGPKAGAITAGKFLELFTKSPFMHIDIAGTAFIKNGDTYRTKGASGVGVRLLFKFFESISKKLIKN